MIDDGSARIAEAEKLSHFIVSFAGCIVARFTKQPVNEAFEDFKQVRMAAADDQRKRGILDARTSLENHGMNVAFDVVDRD